MAGHRSTFSPQKTTLIAKLIFEGQGCIGPRLAQPHPLCFSPDRPDPTGNQANQGTEAKSSDSGPHSGENQHCFAELAWLLTEASWAHSPETRPPLSGERNDLATPQPEQLGATFLASRWEPLDLPESVLNLFLRLEHHLRDASMPLSGLSSLPGVRTHGADQWYATYR